jgi:hypothetical protein
MKKGVFKNDKYKRSRGGDSRLLRICCGKCGKEICSYQKDGPGSLRRMYLDRIIDPLVSLDRKDLSCPEGHLLGVKIVYEKEGRLAFRNYGHRYRTNTE